MLLAACLHFRHHSEGIRPGASSQHRVSFHPALCLYRMISKRRWLHQKVHARVPLSRKMNNRNSRMAIQLVDPNPSGHQDLNPVSYPGCLILQQQLAAPGTQPCVQPMPTNHPCMSLLPRLRKSGSIVYPISTSKYRSIDLEENHYKCLLADWSANS